MHVWLTFFVYTVINCCVCQQSFMCEISTLKVLSLLKTSRPRGQNTPYEQQGGYKLEFVLGDPWLARFQWVDICLLFRDGQLLDYIGLLALPYMDLFSSSEWVRCKSSLGQRDVKTQLHKCVCMVALGREGGAREASGDAARAVPTGVSGGRITSHWEKGLLFKSSRSAIPLCGRPPEAERPLSWLAARGRESGGGGGGLREGLIIRSINMSLMCWKLHAPSWS